MNIKYLLDTNIISEPLKKIPDPKVMKFLEIYEGEYCLCSPVFHEIEFGIEMLEDSRRKKIFKEFLISIKKKLDIISYDDNSSSIHAKERARLMKSGKTPAFVDGQIASISISNNLSLVTKNENGFSIFENISILNPITQSI